jgi:hypothetical protein
MPGNATPRSRRPDLLTRPPWRTDGAVPAWSASIFDPVAPLAELADLLGRGLITRQEYERQKSKVIGDEPAAAPAPAPAPTPASAEPEAGAGSSSCAERRPLPRRAIRRPACGRSSSGGT